MRLIPTRFVLELPTDQGPVRLTSWTSRMVARPPNSPGLPPPPPAPEGYEAVEAYVGIVIDPETGRGWIPGRPLYHSLTPEEVRGLAVIDSSWGESDLTQEPLQKAPPGPPTPTRAPTPRPTPPTSSSATWDATWASIEAALVEVYRVRLDAVAGPGHTTHRDARAAAQFLALEAGIPIVHIGSRLSLTAKGISASQERLARRAEHDPVWAGVIDRMREIMTRPEPQVTP